MSPSRKRVLNYIASHPNSEVADMLGPLSLTDGAIKHHVLALYRSNDLDRKPCFCSRIWNRTFYRYSVKPALEIKQPVFPRIPHKIESLFI